MCKFVLLFHCNYVFILYITEIFSVEYVPLNFELWVIQGHWKWHQSTDRVWFLSVCHSSILYHFLVIWRWIISWPWNLG